MIEITLPWPPKQLNPNFKRSNHWTKYRPQTKKYKADCFTICLEAKIKLPDDVMANAGKIPVRIEFYPPDKRLRDDDNMEGSFKAGRDGLALALGVDDNRFMVERHFYDSVKSGKVVVKI
jgi:crossover junction endodeoxyribonuclease RusA